MFYTTLLYGEKTKLPRKFWAFLEKINGLLFFNFDYCGPFKGGPGQMPAMTLFLKQPCSNPQLIF